MVEEMEIENAHEGIPRALREIKKERERQIEKWGTQTHTPAMWLAILTEEVGEVAKEIADGRVLPFNEEQYCTELIHVAAVASAALQFMRDGIA